MSLVSVVVPTYNHEKYIRGALESIGLQTHRDVEVIVIDDCSTDNSLDVAKSYLETVLDRFANTIVERNESNMGAAATINRGLGLARGEWLTILNSDDRYMPKRFELLLAELGKTGKECGFTGLKLIDAAGAEVFHEKFALAFMCLADKIDAAPAMGALILDENIAHTSGNIFFSRRLHELVGDFCKINLAHDWDYLLRLLAFEEPAFVPEPLYAYRIHTGNTWSKLAFSRYFDPLVIYRRYFRTIAQRAYTNPLFPVYHKLQKTGHIAKFKRMVGGEQINYRETLKGIPDMGGDA